MVKARAKAIKISLIMPTQTEQPMLLNKLRGFYHLKSGQPCLMQREKSSRLNVVVNKVVVVTVIITTTIITTIMARLILELEQPMRLIKLLPPLLLTVPMLVLPLGRAIKKLPYNLESKYVVYSPKLPELQLLATLL